MKSSTPQQDAVVEAWTADVIVLGQTLYHWAVLPGSYSNKHLKFNNFFAEICKRFKSEISVKKDAEEFVIKSDWLGAAKEFWDGIDICS